MRIIVFGDSITWGANDNEGGGWVTRLRNKYAEQDISFYNCGISADNTGHLLARFKVEAQARKSSAGTVILFAIGINDSQYTGTRENTRVLPEDFVANLHALVAQAREITDSVFFLGLNQVEDSKLTPIPWTDKDQNYDNQSVRLYDGLIKQVAGEHALPLLDVYPLLTNEDLDDGLHPNSAGHQKLADAVEVFLTQQEILT